MRGWMEMICKRVARGAGVGRLRGWTGCGERPDSGWKAWRSSLRGWSPR